MQTVQITDITYNPASRAFEARVSLTQGGEVFTYPCSLRAPMDMDSALATRKLIELGKRKHARMIKPLVARRPANVLHAKALAAHVPAEVTSATNALWSRMLGRAA